MQCPPAHRPRRAGLVDRIASLAIRVIPDSEDYAFVLHICEKGVARGDKEGFFGAVGLNMEN